MKNYPQSEIDEIKEEEELYSRRLESTTRTIKYSPKENKRGRLSIYDIGTIRETKGDRK